MASELPSSLSEDTEIPPGIGPTSSEEVYPSKMLPEAQKQIFAAEKADDLSRIPCSLDLKAWRGDLSRLHTTIDQVVQSFISGQTRQLDAIAHELSSQQETVALKERRFSELSDSIANFVEDEAKRLEILGISLGTLEDDARHEAYDAELPGPPALHRINRLWRKATKAFESAREAKDRETAAALEAQKKELEARTAEVERCCNATLAERDAELKTLKENLEALKNIDKEKDTKSASLSDEMETLQRELSKSRKDFEEKVAKVEELEASQKRVEYEREVEREELQRQEQEAKDKCSELERNLQASQNREDELQKKCEDRNDKLQQMKRVMEEQELEMTQKIDRVQHYVKERQTGALHAEKKQQDAEKMAERWQGEVRRLQAEKDKLAALVIDLESCKAGQTDTMKCAAERHRQEVNTLQESLRRKEEEMRSANLELLQRRDEEYQAKVAMEKERERERSIALLRKKEQEVQIKDQQLKAAKQRIQDLEGGRYSCDSTCAGNGTSISTGSPASSRGNSSQGRRPSSSGRGDAGLPPLPLSAR
eukprot:TRINITY_DN39263_c0_g1_i2.p1 TRINITY_DN39263_c0_g1~~TRINITY_DN39263_c0_g1_i2.p1  ORF type:complete len:559 (-),score=156.86 TRINITY_DN39263_c0_g1_i2:60-1682(-)